MFDLGQELGSDEKAGIEGVWVDFGPDSSVKVARLGNNEAMRAYRLLPRAKRRRFEEGTMGDDAGFKFLAGFVAKHLLKDWKGLADDGKLISYSEANAEKMLLKHRRFRDRIWEIAQDEDLFNVAQEVAADVGNS